MQIRARLTLMFMAIAAGILATVLFAVWLTYKTSTEAVFFQNLESRAALTARTVFQKR
ncbi:MAG: hypothetical protein IPH12_06195 [Saprospirales bacterium]|nr:hypothetical protein [Saprospirales bacterium]